MLVDTALKLRNCGLADNKRSSRINTIRSPQVLNFVKTCEMGIVAVNDVREQSFCLRSLGRRKGVSVGLVGLKSCENTSIE